FLHTQAGAEANELLATLLLDRGQYFMSALRFEKLLQMSPKRYKIDDLTLFKTALAYRRAGDVKRADAAWKKLEDHVQTKGGLKVGEELVSFDNLSRVFSNIPGPVSINPSDWPRWFGNLTNSAQAAGS